MKRFAFICAFICCTVAIAFAQTNIVVKDSLGRELTLARTASRIVSLSPEATETLFAIGAGDKVVGDTTYCNYPPAAKALPKIGGYSADTISIESIVALAPQLVVTSGSLHQSIEAALGKLKIPYFAYLPNTFESISESIRILGRLSGTQAKADQVAANLAASLASIKKLTSTLSSDKRPKVFWQVYDEPLMTCGTASFPHQIIELAGGNDIFSDLKGPWPLINAEEVLTRRPDFILSPDDMGDKVNIAALSAKPGWGSLPAVRNKHIALLPADLVSRASPRIYEGVLAALAVLHPDLKLHE